MVSSSRFMPMAPSEDARNTIADRSWNANRVFGWLASSEINNEAGCALPHQGQSDGRRLRSRAGPYAGRPDRSSLEFRGAHRANSAGRPGWRRWHHHGTAQRRHVCRAGKDRHRHPAAWIEPAKAPGRPGAGLLRGRGEMVVSLATTTSSTRSQQAGPRYSTAESSIRRGPTR